LRRIGHFGVRSVSIRARHINDDSLWLVVLRVAFVLDGGESAQKQIARVGHDGGAARGDAVLGLEQKEAGEEVVDGEGRLEIREAGHEGGGKVGKFVFVLGELRMARTEDRIGVGDKEAATSAVDEEMLTAR